MIINTTTTRQSVYRCLPALALAGSLAYAQEAPETELPPVTVSAHDSGAVPYDQTGVSVSVLDIAQLKKEGITTLSEALPSIPGVYALPGGGDYQRGNVCNTAIRGMNKGAYTLPMVDGMRISASGNGNIGANMLARTNLFDLGNAEVLRGAQGATYGSGCMGAVIYLETPKGQGEPGVSTFHEGGSHDSYTGNLTAQGELEKLAYFLSTTYDHTTNDLRYAGGAKPTLPHAGLYRNWSNALRVDVTPDNRDTFTVTYRREDSDYRDASDPGSTTRYEFRSNLVTAAWTAKFSSKWTSKLMAGFYGYDADLGGGYTQDIRNVQVEWRNVYRWSEMSTSTFGLCWSRSDYQTVDTYSKDSSLDNVYSVFAEHTATPTKAWEISLAARLDCGQVADEQGTFRAASSYRIERTHTRLFGSVGTGYNAPSEFQRSRTTYHSPYGGDWTGNPGLHCETSVSADFGAEQQIGKNHYASATLFWTRTQDAIVADYTTAPFSFSYRNASGHQTSQGVELAVRGTFERHWNTGYRAGLTISQPLANGSQIPSTARQVWFADIHTSPVEKFTTGLGLTAACQRTGYDSARLDNYYTLRWYARYDVSENFSLHVRVENLTDQKYVAQPSWQSPEYGMLGAGVSVHGGCSLRF